MEQTSGKDRVFLFLQGPHGPFFQALAEMLSRSGAQCWRVGFNAGDAFFWNDKSSFIPFKKDQSDWAAFFRKTIKTKSVTDLVLYGDTRGIHAKAIKIAKASGIQVHIFEEGYLRPFWITYERDGSNGNSRLMQMTIPEMQKALEGSDLDPPMPPSHWGDMRHHVFYGAVYHWFVMFRNRRFAHFKPHRALNVRQEFRLYARRLLRMPFHAGERWLATRRVRFGGFPYHLALLQLESCSNCKSAKW